MHGLRPKQDRREGGGLWGKNRNGHVIFSFVPCSLTRAFSWILCSSFVFSKSFRSVPFSSVPLRSVLCNFINDDILEFLKGILVFLRYIILTWQLYISRRYFGIFTLYNPDMATIHFSKVFWYFYVI